MAAKSKQRRRGARYEEGYTPIHPEPVKNSDGEAMTDTDIVKYIIQCRDEAKASREYRDRVNEDNWRMFNLDYDFSHKIKGQSTEIIDRVSRTVDKTSLFFQQALTDVSDWWSIRAVRKAAEDLMKIKPDEIYKLTEYQLGKMDHYSIVGKEIRMGLLNGVVITKIMGRDIPRPMYISDSATGIPKRTSKTYWQLRHRLVHPRNYFPDPKPSDDEQLQYECEDMWTDLHEVKKMAAAQPQHYDVKMCEQLKGAGSSNYEEERDRSIQTGQPTDKSTHRIRVKLTEFWGNICDKNGKLIYENVVAVVANDTHLIMKPRQNPRWDQESPYVVTALLEGIDTRWPRAMMDAPAKHNKAIIELWNLILDGACAAANQIKQLRVEWIANAHKFQNGIPNGATLLVNGSAPPAAKVMESVPTGSVPPEAMNIYNMAVQEYNASATDSDLRSGATPYRKVKATEIVEQSNAINSILTGIARNYEQKHLMKKLVKSWSTVAQRLDDYTDDEIVDLLGETAAGRIGGLKPQERFVSTVGGCKFEVSGITRTLKRVEDLQRYQTMLQIVGASDVMAEAFIKEYDFSKVMNEIIESLGIRKSRIERDETERELNNQPPADPMAQPGAGLPNQMSQLPGPQAQSLDGSLASALNQNLGNGGSY